MKRLLVGLLLTCGVISATPTAKAECRCDDGYAKMPYYEPLPPLEEDYVGSECYRLYISANHRGNLRFQQWVYSNCKSQPDCLDCWDEACVAEGLIKNYIWFAQPYWDYLHCVNGTSAMTTPPTWSSNFEFALDLIPSYLLKAA